MKNIKMKILTSLFTAFLCIASVNSGWAKSVDDKIKDSIDNAAGALKGGVDRLGDNLIAIQDYLDNYHWKGLIQDEATSGAATLKHLQLNGYSRAVVVKPGERIQGVVLCNLDSKQCSSLSLYRVVLGIKGKGAQTTIGNELGIIAGESLEDFVLSAPSESGIYQIRYRLVESFTKKAALAAWVDENGDEPSATTTIGVVVVK